MANAGLPTTQSGLWGGVELLDRSPLVLEDGSTAILDRELAEVLQTQLGGVGAQGLASFLNELFYDLGIFSLEDLEGVELATLLEGILLD